MKEGAEVVQLLKSLWESSKLEDVDGTCDEGGSRSISATEESPGILQLIDQLENIVDTLLPG